MESKAVFLDTNIVADMIDSRRPNHALSLRLLEQLTLEFYEVFISEDMVSTLYYISDDKEATLAFLEHVVYIDWHVVSYGKDLLVEATRIASIKKTDLEDTLQCLCARDHGCAALITCDRTFVDCGVPAVDYTTFTQGTSS